jgi:hypothetical protein
MVYRRFLADIIARIQKEVDNIEYSCPLNIELTTKINKEINLLISYLDKHFTRCPSDLITSETFENIPRLMAPKLVDGATGWSFSKIEKSNIEFVNVKRRKESLVKVQKLMLEPRLGVEGHVFVTRVDLLKPSLSNTFEFIIDSLPESLITLLECAEAKICVIRSEPNAPLKKEMHDPRLSLTGLFRKSDAFIISGCSIKSEKDNSQKQTNVECTFRNYQIDTEDDFINIRASRIVKSEKELNFDLNDTEAKHKHEGIDNSISDGGDFSSENHRETPSKEPQISSRKVSKIKTNKHKQRKRVTKRKQSLGETEVGKCRLCNVALRLNEVDPMIRQTLNG